MSWGSGSGSLSGSTTGCAGFAGSGDGSFQPAVNVLGRNPSQPIKAIHAASNTSDRTVDG